MKESGPRSKASNRLATADRLIREQQPEKAIALLQEEIQASTGNPMVFNKLGSLLMQENRLNEALAVYQQAVQRRPKAHGLYSMIGQCQEKKGDNKGAADSYRKAIALAPKKAWLHERLGAVLRELEMWQDAADAYQSAIQLNPEAPRLHNWLGLCQAQTGDLKGATASYQKEFEINPLQQARLHLKFAEDLYQKGRLDEAINLYETMVEFQPVLSLHFYHALADALQQTGRIDEAIAAYKKAADSTPNDDKGYLRLGSLCASAERSAQAIKAFQKAFDIKPDQPWPVHHAFSTVLKQCQRFEEANGQMKSGPTVPSEHGSAFLKIWDALNSPDRENLDHSPSIYPEEPDGSVVAQYFIQSSTYQFFALDELAPADQSALEQLDLSIDVLREYKADSLGGAEPGRTFFSRLVKHGYIAARCPISGRSVQSNHSLSADETFTRGIFLLQGDKPFYLITNIEWTAIQALYLPADDVIITFDHCEPEQALTDLVNQLKTTTVTRWRAVADYLANRAAKRILCPLNVIHPAGHAIWTGLAGIQWLSLNEQLDKIDRFLIEADAIINDLDTIAPGITSDQVIIANRGSNDPVLDVILNNQYFAVRCNRALISAALADNLIAIARDATPAATLTVIEDAKRHTPLLWVTIDAGPARWASQVSGLETIINNLATRFPGLAVVLCGTPAPTRPHRTAYEEAWREKEKALADEIRHFLHPAIRVFNLLEKPASEHIVWATEVDLYVAPRDHGLTVLPWIANKPGVVHGIAGQTTPKSESDFRTLREQVNIPVAIESTPDNAGQSRHYVCDWFEIEQVLTTQILELGLDRPQQPPKAGFFKSLTGHFKPRSN